LSSQSEGLVVEEVSHQYGRTPVVRGASLQILPGEIHSLLGPSGSGKTTLLRLVAGLEVLREGRITIAGRTVAEPNRHVPPESRCVGFVFQDYALFPHLSVRSNVLFGLRGASRRERLRRADELLASVGMSAFVRAMPHTLSGGQQQRVALARALASQPTVMLLDEPFSGLDVRLRGEVRNLTRNILHAAGVATMLVTHDPQEALLISDRITVIREGRVEQTGPPDELYFRPKTLHVAEIFGLTNRFAVEVHHGAVSTPWGLLPAPGREEGERLTLLIRPESLQLGDAGREGGVDAEIVEMTLQGDTSAVQLALATGEVVTAVVSPYSQWQGGARTTVHLAADSAILLDSADSNHPGPDRQAQQRK
jgi:iron(III) transport system ATP-binding protein